MEMSIQNRKILCSVGELFDHVGEFGMFQKFLVAVMCFSDCYYSYQTVIMYFATLVPSWECHSNSSSCQLSGEMKGDDMRRCDIPRDQWYFTESKEFSLVTQFDVPCHQQWILNLTVSMHLIGFAVGSILFGWVGDKYGRKLVFFPCSFFMLLFGLIVAFMPNIVLIIACRFAEGIFAGGMSSQKVVYVSEMVGSRKRSLAMLWVFSTFPFSFSLVGIKAYLLKDWRKLCIISTAPYFIIFMFYKIIPESVTWLQSKGQTEAAMCVFRNIAKRNNRQLSNNITLNTKPEGNALSEDPSGEGNLRDTIVIVIIQCMVWGGTSLVYFGLQFVSHKLGGDIYINYIMLSLVDLPALLIAFFSNDRWGRKKTNLIPLAFATICCLIIALPVTLPTTITVVVAVVGKLMVTVTYITLYIWSAELLPTKFRSTGLGVVECVSRLIGACAPLVTEGATLQRNMMFLILGLPAIVGTLTGIYLPETKPNN